jgi:hypothetical protein
MRTPITILFSDIKGSTAYFEKRGDEGLVMVQRHNNLLIPVIEGVAVKGRENNWRRDHGVLQRSSGRG